MMKIYVAVESLRERNFQKFAASSRRYRERE